MGLFDGGHTAELGGQLGEAFLFRILGKAVVHVGPLVVFTLGGSLQIGGGVANAAQFLKPEFCMLLLVAGGMQKDGGNLVIPFAGRHIGKIGVLVAGLAFAGKGLLQVLFCLGAGIGVVGCGGFFHLDKNRAGLTAHGADEIIRRLAFMNVAAYGTAILFHCFFSSLIKNIIQRPGSFQGETFRLLLIQHGFDKSSGIVALRQHVVAFAEDILLHDAVG